MQRNTRKRARDETRDFKQRKLRAQKSNARREFRRVRSAQRRVSRCVKRGYFFSGDLKFFPD